MSGFRRRLNLVYVNLGICMHKEYLQKASLDVRLPTLLITLFAIYSNEVIVWMKILEDNTRYSFSVFLLFFEL